MGRRLMDAKIRIRTVCDSLEGHYGKPKPLSEQDPLDVLVKVILSQNTTDVASFAAFDRLKREYPTWKQVLAAPTKRIERIIKPAGLAPTKSKRIKGVLKEIARQRGELSIDFLKGLPTEQARGWLTSLNGVGPKSAAIVLNFSFGRPEFPVDTHVHRVAGRLGFYDSAKVGREKAYEIMNKLCPNARKTACHINLVRLGREVCVPGRPLCPLCPLQKSCAFYADKMEGWYGKHPEEKRTVVERGIRRADTSAIHGVWAKGKR